MSPHSASSDLLLFSKISVRRSCCVGRVETQRVLEVLFVASSTGTNMNMYSSGSRRKQQLRRPVQPAPPDMQTAKGENSHAPSEAAPGQETQGKPKTSPRKTLWYCHDGISLRWCICLDRAKNSSAHHLHGLSQSPLPSQRYTRQVTGRISTLPSCTRHIKVSIRVPKAQTTQDKDELSQLR